NNGQLMGSIHLPQRQRDTDLGVVALRAPGDAIIGSEQLCQPFLYHSLAVAAGNTKYRIGKSRTVRRSEFLKRQQRVFDYDKVRVMKSPNLAPAIGNDIIAYASRIGIADIPVAIPPIDQSEKKPISRIYHPTAIV